MATKKTTPAAKSTGKELQPWEQRAAAKAQEAAATASSTGGGSKAIKTRGGRFTIDGAEVQDNVLQVIVLDSILENHIYDQSFDPDDLSSPVCFAFGRDYKTMAPIPEDVQDLKHPTCYECELGGVNAWGTADKGRGKACKNARRLIVMSEGDLDNIPQAEARRLTVPVTSGKAWDGYVKSLIPHNRPPCGVLTEISIVPHPKTQFELKFKMLGLVEDEFMNELLDKCDSIQDDLVRPYTPMEAEEKPAGKGASKAQAKNPANRSRKR